jgi:hypothetical protein
MTGLSSTDRQHSPQPHETCGACIAAGLQRAGREDEALEFLNSNPLSETLVVSSLGQIGCSAHLPSVSHHGENQHIAS